MASRKLASWRLVCLAASVTLGLAMLPNMPAHAETTAPGDFRVIVNVHNPAGSAAREFLADVFLKRASRWESGEPARPVDLRPDSGARRAFSLGILKRPVAAVRRYWQQRIFSGRDVPPPELDSDESVTRYVATHAGAIGYVSFSVQLGDGVKVLSVRQ